MPVKKDCDIHELIRTDDFYIGLDENGMPYLKKKHSSRYYNQIQTILGLARAEGCDFIVYVYDGLISVRVKFNETYFCSILRKSSSFYKDHLMPYHVSS